MLILSIDQSTAAGNAAILDGRRLVARRCWEETFACRQQIFPSLRAMLDDAGIKAGDIRLYVVGVGPGSYSGLRVAMAATLAMALPDRTPVYGVTSAETLAWQAAEAKPAAQVLVVGDARRDQWWSRSYCRNDELMSTEGNWVLAPAGVLPKTENAAVATPDWARIGPQLRAAVPPDVPLIERALLPDAATLAMLARARMARSIESEPLTPVYLHPAVQSK